MDLPLKYHSLTPTQKRKVREEYVKIQNGKCWFCHKSLENPPIKDITKYKLNLKLFPPGFLKHPIHLQHDHVTGYTEGAVHAYCNGVLFQYFNR